MKSVIESLDLAMGVLIILVALTWNYHEIQKQSQVLDQWGEAPIQVQDVTPLYSYDQVAFQLQAKPEAIQVISYTKEGATTLYPDVAHFLQALSPEEKASQFRFRYYLEVKQEGRVEVVLE